MNKTIYYFSATGNSLQAALDIAEGLGGADVISMTKAGMNAACDSEVIGFAFPCFALGLPNMVHDFIKSGSFCKDAYIFAVATCGMSMGESAVRIDALLREKGAKLSYGVKHRMVANYIAMYDTKPKTQAKLLADSDKRLAGIISDLKARKTNRFTKGLPFAVAMHRKFSAQYKDSDRDFNISDSCNGCKLCASVCPARNIEVEDKPTFKHNCEHCMACVHWCPQKAINYKDKTQNRNRYHHPKVKAEQLP